MECNKRLISSTGPWQDAPDRQEQSRPHGLTCDRTLSLEENRLAGLTYKTGETPETEVVKQSYFYEYVPRSDRISRIQMADGSAWEYQYDDDDQLRRALLRNFGGLVLAGCDFYYVQSAAHAMSRHDVRGKFPVTLFADDPRVSQAWFAGVHSDVGGAYGTGKAQGYIPLYWMWMKAAEAGVPVAAFPQDKYSAIMRYRMRHDLDWNQLWSDNPGDIAVDPCHDSATGVLYFGDRVKRWFRGFFGGDPYKRKQYVR